MSNLDTLVLRNMHRQRYQEAVTKFCFLPNVWIDGATKDFKISSKNIFVTLTMPQAPIYEEEKDMKLYIHFSPYSYNKSCCIFTKQFVKLRQRRVAYEHLLPIEPRIRFINKLNKNRHNDQGVQNSSDQASYLYCFLRYNQSINQ